MKVVPELLCVDLDVTRAFYEDVLGFSVKYERPDERFIYFTLNGVDLMCEEAAGPGRRWVTGELVPPLGRGVNFQWDVEDVELLYARVRKRRPDSIYLAIESQVYVAGHNVIDQRQFIVQDPDGYLFRFCNWQQSSSD